VRANQYNNYSYESLRKILSNKLDKIGSVNPLVAKTENLEETAYMRSADEYISDMEVNYVQ
jgi:PHD/YefM family antitoxin component YafN of YafNO toxin-antitoxin module